MQSDWSAKRTCREFESAVEWTATVSTPSSRAARITRSAISPRLAMRMRWNTKTSSHNMYTLKTQSLRRLRRPRLSRFRRPRLSRLRRPRLHGLEAEERLAVLHGAAVLDQHLDQAPGLLRL